MLQERWPGKEEGIYIRNIYDECQTPRVNEVFRQIAVLAMGLHQIKNGNKTFYSNVPVAVEGRGERSKCFVEDLGRIARFIGRIMILIFALWIQGWS
jgi:hypothetical protein